VIGCLVAPLINNPALKGAFNFIQEFQGFISPGILTIFLFGLFVPQSAKACRRGRSRAQPGDLRRTVSDHKVHGL
jgi:uncharacterized sodium:solute symporter family permease YidK